MTSAVGSMASCILHARRARTWAGSHGLVVTKCARACRLLSSPSRAAIGSTDLRLPSNSRPRTYACPQRRWSARVNASNISAANASRSSRTTAISPGVTPQQRDTPPKGHATAVPT